jgi:hypothetical protein
MAKAELKTRETGESVDAFSDTVEDEQRRVDSYKVIELMKRVTGEEPKMWGPAIVGFGHTTVKYSTGRELEWLVTGFSPRKTSLTLYVLNNFPMQAELLTRLGKHKASGGCLHIKRLSDVDEGVLESLVKASIEKATGEK